MLLMHGYATFNMIVATDFLPLRDVYCSALEGALRSRDIDKAKQNSARNNAKCSKCFQFFMQ